MRTPPSLLIAEAPYTDIPALMELERHCFPEMPLSQAHFIRFIKSPSIQIVTAKNDQAMVGYGVLFFRKNSTRARLFSLAVHPRFQRQGIGRRLLDWAENEARAHTKKGLTLEVQTRNSAAMALYLHAHFLEKGIYQDFYGPGKHAALLMKEW